MPEQRAAVPDNRACEYYAPVALVAHHKHRLAGAVEAACQIRLYQPIPIFVGYFKNILRLRCACVVGEYVEPSKLVLYVFEKGSHCAGVCDVALHCDRYAAGVFYLANDVFCLFKVVGVAVIYYYDRAALSEFKGYSAPYALR